jgi:hypothetical protein
MMAPPQQLEVLIGDEAAAELGITLMYACVLILA